MVCYFTKGGRGLTTCSLRLRTTSQVHGYGRQFRCGRFLLFTLESGQQRHWLSFSRPDLYEPHLDPNLNTGLGRLNSFPLSTV